MRQLVDNLFRTQAREITLVLTRRFGPQRLDLVEASVQEAMLRALRTWPESGVPDAPGGWLLRAATNVILDGLRRQATRDRKESELVSEGAFGALPSIGYVHTAAPEIWEDDTLKMMLICCHPSIDRTAQLALILRNVCGLGVDQVSAAMLKQPDAIKKLLTRAKQRIRKEQLPFELPPDEQLPERIGRALDAVYLLFNEGYASAVEDQLLRRELCDEALRIAQLILSSSGRSQPAVHALLALMLLQAARFSARLDDAGRVVTLEDQNRALYDPALVKKGLYHLSASATGNTQSTYHFQAAIAACHVSASSYAETPWRTILALYDDLMSVAPSPIVRLNRSVALAMVEGPAAALCELKELGEVRALRHYHLLPALAADFHRRLGNKKEAKSAYESALALVSSQPQRAFIERRLGELDFDYAGQKANLGESQSRG